RGTNRTRSQEATVSFANAASKLSYREALRQMLAQHAFLDAAPDQPLRSRDGSPGATIFYSWQVTLTAEGATLAARCLLERLQGFESTQLATLGATAVPLLTACILLGAPRYTGLFL